jgi:drug/metabolite transporter (DMT)-like permease
MKDYNNDGNIDSDDAEIAKALHEINVKNAKLETQKKMAWVCLWMIAVVTFILFMPFISEPRIDALSDLLGLFYISCASIVGAFVGVTAWMNKGGR